MAMAVHDDLARKAVSMGKSAAEFRAAAQKHANATWLWGIATVAVWYFLGWWWGLIPAALGAYSVFRSVSATKIASRIEEWGHGGDVQQSGFVPIVQAYGKVLESGAPPPSAVADLTKLPYPKRVIKEALIAALKATEDSAMKNHLRTGYMELASWQEGVGDSDQGLDISTLDTSKSPEIVAGKVLEHSKDLERWREIVKQEQETLKRELQELDLW